MFQAKGSAGLVDKFLEVFVGEPRLQHLDGRQGIVVEMFAQVDIAKATFPKKANQAILTKALPNAIGHLQTPGYDALHVGVPIVE